MTLFTKISNGSKKIEVGIKSGERRANLPCLSGIIDHKYLSCSQAAAAHMRGKIREERGHACDGREDVRLFAVGLAEGSRVEDVRGVGRPRRVREGLQGCTRVCVCVREDVVRGTARGEYEHIFK